MVFYTQLLPIIFRRCYVFQAPRISICDVGANAARGLALICDVFNNLTGFNVALTAYDIQPEYKAYA